MAYGRSQSDIATVRDQLSIDYAEGKYLNVVTANLGIERPAFGFSDAVWRAAVKAIALRYKQVRSAFESVLDVVLGPQHYRVTVLAADADVGDRTLQVLNASDLPQCGTLVLDRGLPEEETLDYVFVDYATNVVYLADETTKSHTKNAGSMDLEPRTFLVTDAPAGSLSLATYDSAQFPTSGFPYTIVLGQGTDSEESVVVISNAGNTLTLQNATTVDHFAPRPSVIYTTVSVSYGSQALFLTGDDTTQFPPSGFLKLGGTEIVEFTSNDTDSGVFNLKTHLSGSHPVGTRIELLDVKEEITAGQVQVEGCGWRLYQTAPRRVEIYIPEHCQDIGDLFSASYLHGTASAPASSTLAVLASSGDEYLDLVSTAAFPDSGTVTVEPGSLQTRTAFYKAPTTPNRLMLLSPISSSHPLGAAVTLYQPTHTSNLLSGDMFNVPDVWAGPYVYAPNEQGPSYAGAVLTEPLAGPTRVMLAIDDTAVTAVEVEDASWFPSLFPFTARIGAGTGNREDLEVTSIAFKQVAATTVDAAGSSVGDTFIPCVSGTVTSFPNARGYRVRINRGAPTEEVAYVLQRTSTGLHVDSPLTHAHSATESVELLNDVLTVTSVGDQHVGVFPFDQRSAVRPSFGPHHRESYAEVIQPVYSSFDVNSGTGFDSSRQTLWLNFGHTVVSARAQLASSVSAGSTSLTLGDTSNLPASSYAPYYVVLGAGTYNQEIVRITANNTGTNQLAVDPSTPCRYVHAANEWVEFRAPTPEIVQIDSRIGNTFRFSTPTVLNSNHMVGETVCVAQESVPDPYGTDFPLRMPPDVITRLRFLLDLVRAGGIEVVFLTKR